MDFAKVREWYILVIGLIFIMIIGVVGAYYPAPTSASSTAVESAAQSPQRAGSDAPAQTGIADSDHGTQCFRSPDPCQCRVAGTFRSKISGAALRDCACSAQPHSGRETGGCGPDCGPRRPEYGASDKSVSVGAGFICRCRGRPACLSKVPGVPFAHTG